MMNSLKKEGNAMPVDMSLFLQNIDMTFSNQQEQQTRFLLDYAINLARSGSCSPSLFPLDVSLGLHRGRIRDENEDSVLAIGGTRPETQEVFGLFVVCDGMGGHAHGQEAAYLAIQTMLASVFPLLMDGTASSPWESVLAESIQVANRAIHLRNQSREQQAAVRNIHGRRTVSTSQIHRMGTTVTAALLFGETVFIANVGDSRTYLYETQGLRRATKDHSVVASLVEQGIITEQDCYVHPERNKITRALGIGSSVEVDTFVVAFPAGAKLMLCSDGMWEMTRDPSIEAILASPWASASLMTNQLVQLALDGGGADNISCLLIQRQQADTSTLETSVLDPVSTVAEMQ